MAIIALVLLILKILVDLFIYIIKIINQRKNLQFSSDGVTCQYLQKCENSNICTNVLFKRNMKTGICPRHNCWGFNIRKPKENDPDIISAPLFLSIKKIIDLFPEFAAILLSLNEILYK